MRERAEYVCQIESWMSERVFRDFVLGYEGVFVRGREHGWTERSGAFRCVSEAGILVSE